MQNKIRLLGGFFLLAAVAVAVLLMNGGPVASQEDQPSAWTVRCGKNAEEGDRCEIFQRLVLKETGQRVTEFAIGYPKEEGKAKSARGVIVLPLGIMLADGVQMQIDEGQVFKFQVRYCTQQGCFAYINLNEPVLEMMRKGTSARITFKDPRGKDINLALSLAGFAKSLREVS